jgi:hypothetical protein
VLLQISLLDLAPFFAAPFSISLNEEMPRRSQERLDRRVADRRLMVDLPRLVEKLPLIPSGRIHTRSECQSVLRASQSAALTRIHKSLRVTRAYCARGMSQ